VKIKDTGVFQITVDDRDNSNAIGNAGSSGSKAAHTANKEIDLYSRLAGGVELIDDGWINKTINLGYDARRLARPRVLRFFATRTIKNSSRLS
jgi:hypothetical protein